MLAEPQDEGLFSPGNSDFFSIYVNLYFKTNEYVLLDQIREFIGISFRDKIQYLIPEWYSNEVS